MGVRWPHSLPSLRTRNFSRSQGMRRWPWQRTAYGVGPAVEAMLQIAPDLELEFASELGAATRKHFVHNVVSKLAGTGSLVGDVGEAFAAKGAGR